MSELELVCSASGVLALIGAMAYMQYEIEKVRFDLFCLEVKVKGEEERRSRVYE